jgi:hypothetical protein
MKIKRSVVRRKSAAFPEKHFVPALEEHFTVEEIAKLWKVSPVTVRRMFQDQPGVLSIKGRRSVLGARSYTSLRISASALQRLHEQRSTGFALKVKGSGRLVK